MNARSKSPCDSDSNTDFKLSLISLPSQNPSSKEKFQVDLEDAKHQLDIANKRHDEALTKLKQLKVKSARQTGCWIHVCVKSIIAVVKLS